MYSFINQDDTQQITVSSDKKNFNKVNDAMKIVGFDEHTIQTIWNIVASIIHLGNIKFTETETCDKCGISKHSMSNEVKAISKLLNIDHNELVNALTTRIIATGSRDIVSVNFTVKDAVYGRDAFAKVTRTLSAALKFLNKAIYLDIQGDLRASVLIDSAENKRNSWDQT